MTKSFTVDFDHSQSTISGALGISDERLEELQAAANMAHTNSESHTVSEDIDKAIKIAEATPAEALMIAYAIGAHVAHRRSASMGDMLGSLEA